MDYETEGLKKYAEWEQKCADPAYLADAAQGWRDILGLTVKEAAHLLGLPWRTLEGIEQGRGFRYPKMLMHAMIEIDKGSAHAPVRQRKTREQN